MWGQPVLGHGTGDQQKAVLVRRGRVRGGLLPPKRTACSALPLPVRPKRVRLPAVRRHRQDKLSLGVLVRGPSLRQGAVHQERQAAAEEAVLVRIQGMWVAAVPQHGPA